MLTRNWVHRVERLPRNYVILQKSRFNKKKTFYDEVSSSCKEMADSTALSQMQESGGLGPGLQTVGTGELLGAAWKIFMLGISWASTCSPISQICGGGGGVARPSPPPRCHILPSPLAFLIPCSSILQDSFLPSSTAPLP